MPRAAGTAERVDLIFVSGPTAEALFARARPQVLFDSESVPIVDPGPEDVRALDDIRYAFPMPFAEYLEFATRWSDEWVQRHGMRHFDDGPAEPFQL